jgi:hypothetical protein
LCADTETKIFSLSSSSSSSSSLVISVGPKIGGKRTGKKGKSGIIISIPVIIVIIIHGVLPGKVTGCS